MGTSDSELNKMAKDLGIKNYRGCYMKDQLKNLEPKNVECFILNFEDSDSSGSHWSAVWHEGNSKIFFDSFGTNPPFELINYLGPGILSSTFQIQKINTDICGELCILILYLLDSGYSFEEIILDIVCRFA